MISVIMCVYNGEAYVEKAIRSICNQTYKDFEFIIIDDGSTDNSLNIIKEYMKNDSRIVLVTNKHEGIVHSANLGISKARGEYIARMDSDDLAHPLRFEMELNVLEKNPKIGVVSTQGFYVYNYEKIKFINRSIHSDEIAFSLISNNKIINSSTIFRKELIHNKAYSHEFNLMEDYHFWVSLIGETQFYTIPIPLVLRNKRSDSVTGFYRDNISEVLLQTKRIQTLALQKNSIKPPLYLDSFSSITRRLYSNNTSIDEAIKSYLFILKQMPSKYRKILRTDFYESMFIYIRMNKQVIHFNELRFVIIIKCVFFEILSNLYSRIKVRAFFKYLKDFKEIE